MNNQKFFQEAMVLMQELLGLNSKNLDDESIAAVKHYLDHGEYEMAFEGLFLDLMQVGNVISDKNLEIYFDLGKKFGLDQDSVFDCDFWFKFQKFINNIEPLAKP